MWDQVFAFEEARAAKFIKFMHAAVQLRSSGQGESRKDGKEKAPRWILVWILIGTESQRGEIYRAHQGDEQHRGDQHFLHEQVLEQNQELREAHEENLNEMEELKRFQGSTFDGFSRRRLIENRDTIFELTGKIQELQNEIN